MVLGGGGDSRAIIKELTKGRGHNIMKRSTEISDYRLMHNGLKLQQIITRFCLGSI